MYCGYGLWIWCFGFQFVVNSVVVVYFVLLWFGFRCLVVYFDVLFSKLVLVLGCLIAMTCGWWCLVCFVVWVFVACGASMYWFDD